jgi:hypothetical protein
MKLEEEFRRAALIRLEEEVRLTGVPDGGYTNSRALREQRRLGDELQRKLGRDPVAERRYDQEQRMLRKHG